MPQPLPGQLSGQLSAINIRNIRGYRGQGFEPDTGADSGSFNSELWLFYLLRTGLFVNWVEYLPWKVVFNTIMHMNYVVQCLALDTSA